jgi:hypothetical protein
MYRPGAVTCPTFSQVILLTLNRVVPLLESRRCAAGGSAPAEASKRAELSHGEAASGWLPPTTAAQPPPSASALLFVGVVSLGGSFPVWQRHHRLNYLLRVISFMPSSEMTRLPSTSSA